MSPAQSLDKLKSIIHYDKIVKLNLTTTLLLLVLGISIIALSLNINRNLNNSDTRVKTKAASNLSPLPLIWPYSNVELGMADEKGNASQTAATAPFKFRYHYLTSSADTCKWCSWETWGSSDGVTKSDYYETSYIQESVASGMTPIFTFYNMYSVAGNTEGNTEVAAINDVNKMTAYFNDVKVFLKGAAKYPNSPVILHMEPDFWGYLQQSSQNNDASTIPAQINSIGFTELSSLPNNAAGFAQAVLKLRDTYAPNVLVSYHLSEWGTNTDPVYGSPTDSTIIGLAANSSSFYNSFHANFDLTFDDPLDRDAGYYDLVWKNPNAWWDETDYHNNILYLTNFSQATGKRIIEWQIPYGNTKMKTENNTNNHYQDNHVESILSDSSRIKLNDYMNAGVIGFVFGRGAGGQSGPSDDNNDGVTNPASITYRNSTTSITTVLGAAGSVPALSSDGLTLTTPYAKDDDGGYFRWRAYDYYKTGAVVLGSSPMLTPTASPTIVAGSTTTPTPTIAPTQVIASPTPTTDPVIIGAADTTPPTVQLTNPTNGMVIKSNMLNITANASDNVKVTKVEFYLDDKLIDTDSYTPYASKQQAGKWSVGQHVIMAKSYDAAGNSATSQVTVTK